MKLLDWMALYSCILLMLFSVGFYNGKSAATQQMGKSSGNAQRGGSVPKIMGGAERGIIPDAWLSAVAMHESKGNIHAVNKNKDGTLDIGLFQINSSLARRYHVNPSSLLFDHWTSRELAITQLANCKARAYKKGYRGRNLRTMTFGCYNIGEGKMFKREWQKHIQQYAAKVERYLG